MSTPGDASSALGRSTAARAVRGARWVLWLNLATIPMSFATSLVLGRRSAAALGVYSAVQLFIGGFQTFFILGGNALFARFVPPMARERRFPFLVSYTAMVVGIFAAACMVGTWVSPERVRALLHRFADPPVPLVFGLGIAVIVWAFSSHFLYSLEQAPRATIGLKAVVFGYFVFSSLCLLPGWRSVLDRPAAPIWTTTGLVYGCAALLAAFFVAGAEETRRARGPWFRLPGGFWPALAYTHVGTVVEFIYTSLAPMLVLLWIDVEALGRLSAALRWVALLAILPVTLTSVVAPAASKLAAAGMTSEALRQGASAMRACQMAIVPAVLALVLFASDFMAIFGGDYREYSMILRIAALSALAGPLVYLGGGIAVAFGAYRGYLTVSMAYVVTSIAAGAALVPVFGLTGAAVATTVGTAIQFGAVAVLLRGRLGMSLPSSVFVGWGFGLIALLLTCVLPHHRAVAAFVWIVLTAGFGLAARVRPRDISLLIARARGAAP